MASASPSDSALLQQIWLKVKNLDAMEKKLDGLDSKFNEISGKVTELSNTVSAHATSIAEIQAELAKTKADMKTLKTNQNSREQRLRATTVRLFNFPSFTGESLDNFKALATKVYERVLRPTLVAAKAAGDVGSVPQLQNVIESCFRIYPQSPAPPSSPSPIIICLVNNSVKSAVMKHRKHIQSPSDSEKEATGGRRFILVEDLTPEAHGLLKALQQDDRTEKVWSFNGHIHFTKPGVQGYKKVKNIFDPLDTILQ